MPAPAPARTPSDLAAAAVGDVTRVPRSPTDLWLRRLSRRLESQGAGTAGAPQGAGSARVGSASAPRRPKSRNGIVAASRSWRHEKRLPEPRQLHARERNAEKAQRKRAKERDKAAHARRRTRAAMRARIKQGASRWLDRWRPGAPDNVMERAPTLAPRRSTHRPVASAAAGGGRGERSSSSGMRSAMSWPPSGRLSTGWRRCCQPEPARPRCTSCSGAWRTCSAPSPTRTARSPRHSSVRVCSTSRGWTIDGSPAASASFCAMTVQSSWARGRARSDSSCCTGSPSSAGW